MKRNKQRTYFTVYLLFIFILTTSCQGNTFYHSYQPVPTTGWSRSDTLVYPLATPIFNKDYIFDIGIRHKDSYQYRDIWLTINQDTLHLYLADSIGNWEGKGIGETRQLIYPWKNNKLYPDSIHEFRIAHIMQDNPLTGILDIGIQVKKVP